MSKRLRITLGSILIIAIVTIGVVAYVIAQLSRPVQGITSIGQSTDSPTALTISLAPTAEASPYVSFDYPAGLTRENTGPIHTPSVADFIFSAHDITSWLMAIDISTNPSGSLSGNSSFTIRKNNPSEYQESQIDIHGQSIPIMTDTTAAGFSKVAYLVHGNLLATVSLLGDDATGTQPLQTTFMMVLNSWQWQ